MEQICSYYEFSFKNKKLKQHFFLHTNEQNCEYEEEKMGISI